MISITIENAIRIPQDGKCPSCLSQILIRESNGQIYKTRIYKKFENGVRVLKCVGSKCKRYFIER